MVGAEGALYDAVGVRGYEEENGHVSLGITFIWKVRSKHPTERNDTSNRVGWWEKISFWHFFLSTSVDTLATGPFGWHSSLGNRQLGEHPWQLKTSKSISSFSVIPQLIDFCWFAEILNNREPKRNSSYNLSVGIKLRPSFFLASSPSLNIKLVWYSQMTKDPILHAKLSNYILWAWIWW